MCVSDVPEIPHKDILKNVISKPVISTLALTELDWKNITSKYKKLTKGFIVSSKLVKEPPIAGKIIFKKTIKKIETSEPPDGIYELPEGAVKIKNWKSRK